MNTNALAIMPVMEIPDALMRRQAIVEFTKQLMHEGTDFGKVPGSDKPTLLKPGAEKLATLFGLLPVFESLEVVQDWSGRDHGGEAFFFYRYKCRLTRGDLVVGEGIGSCNSWEKKYRYRTAERVCPECGKSAIIKGKKEYGGGWLCWKQKDGCGAKFRDGDDAIESQPVGKVANSDPADIVNTIDKMAQKRALIAATLIAVNASEFFTQDIEDMDLGHVIEGEIIQAPPQRKPDPPRKQAPPPPATWEDIAPAAPTNGNGKQTGNREADARAWLEGIRHKTLGDVAKAAAMSGRYAYPQAAIDELKGNPLVMERGIIPYAKKAVTDETALELFDWLTAGDADLDMPELADLDETQSDNGPAAQ